MHALVYLIPIFVHEQTLVLHLSFIQIYLKHTAIATFESNIDCLLFSGDYIVSLQAVDVRFSKQFNRRKPKKRPIYIPCEFTFRYSSDCLIRDIMVGVCSTVSLCQLLSQKE